MNVGFFIILVIAAAGCAYVIYLSLRRQGALLDALKNLAVTQGWTFAHTPASVGTPSSTTLTNTSENWTMTITGSGGDGGVHHRRVEWHTPMHPTKTGAAVFGPPLRKEVATIMQGPLPGMADKMIKSLMFQYVEGLGDIAKDIKLIKDTTDDPRGIVMASPGQEGAVDAIRDNTALADAKDAQSDDLKPIVIRDTTGLRLRVRGCIKPPERLKAFADLGIAIRREFDV